MKTSHYLKKAGAVCMAAAMMTGCASGSSGTNGKTLTVGLNTGFNGIFSPLYYQTVYDDYVIEMVNIPWWRSHSIHENRATKSIWTEPCNPLLRATKSTKRATSA